MTVDLTKNCGMVLLDEVEMEKKVQQSKVFISSRARRQERKSNNRNVYFLVDFGLGLGKRKARDCCSSFYNFSDCVFM